MLTPKQKIARLRKQEQQVWKQLEIADAKRCAALQEFDKLRIKMFNILYHLKRWEGENKSSTKKDNANEKRQCNVWCFVWKRSY